MLIFKLKNIYPFQFNLIYSQIRSFTDEDVIIKDYDDDYIIKNEDFLIKSEVPFLILTDIFINKIKSNQNFYYNTDTIQIKHGNSKNSNLLIKNNDNYDKHVDICFFSSFYKFIQNYNKFISYQIKNLNLQYDKYDTLSIIYIWKKISFFPEIIDNLIKSIKNSSIKIILLVKDYQKFIKKYTNLVVEDGPYFENIDDMHQYIIAKKLTF